jgi:hypothetical protein
MYYVGNHNTSVIFPYRSNRDTIPVPSVARVHFCPQNFGIKYYQLWLPFFLLDNFWYLHTTIVEDN